MARISGATRATSTPASFPKPPAPKKSAPNFAFSLAASPWAQAPFRSSPSAFPIPTSTPSATTSSPITTASRAGKRTCLLRSNPPPPGLPKAVRPNPPTFSLVITFGLSWIATAPPPTTSASSILFRRPWMRTTRTGASCGHRSSSASPTPLILPSSTSTVFQPRRTHPTRFTGSAASPKNRTTSHSLALTTRSCRSASPQNYFTQLATARFRVIGHGPGAAAPVLETIPPVPSVKRLGDTIPPRRQSEKPAPMPSHPSRSTRPPNSNFVPRMPPPANRVCCSRPRRTPSTPAT